MADISETRGRHPELARALRRTHMQVIHMHAVERAALRSCHALEVGGCGLGMYGSGRAKLSILSSMVDASFDEGLLDSAADCLRRCRIARWDADCPLCDRLACAGFALVVMVCPSMLQST